MSVSIYDIPLDVISLMSEYMDKRIWFLNTCTRFRAIFLKLYSTKHGREQLFGDNRTVVRLADQASIIVYDPTGQKIWCHICKIYIKKDKYQTHVLKQKMHRRNNIYICVCFGKHDEECLLSKKQCIVCSSSVFYKNTMYRIWQLRGHCMFDCLSCNQKAFLPDGCLGCMTFVCSPIGCSVCRRSYHCTQVRNHICIPWVYSP